MKFPAAFRYGIGIAGIARGRTLARLRMSIDSAEPRRLNVKVIGTATWYTLQVRSESADGHKWSESAATS